MTEIEDRLRAELAREAERAQPGQLRPLRNPGARSRSWRWYAFSLAGARARPWLAPLFAAAAVIVVVAAVWLASGALGGGQAAMTAPAAMPRFYVVVAGPKDFRVTVYRSATGQVLTSARLPGRPPQNQLWAAAAGDDRTFATAVAERVDGVLITRVFMLFLGRTGDVEHLVPARLPAIPGTAITGLALSPDGRKIAVAFTNASRPGGRVFAKIEVASLATGKTRTWVAQRAADARAFDLAWTNGDRYLGFAWTSSSSDTVLPDIGQIRLLDTSSPGGLLASRVLAAARGSGTGFLEDGLVLPDGRAIVASGYQLPRVLGGRPVPDTLVELSVPGGHVVRSLLSRPRNQNVCEIMSVAAGGHHVLLRCVVFDRLDNGRITRLPDIGEGATAAW